MLDAANPNSLTSNRIVESSNHYAQEADGIYILATLEHPNGITSTRSYEPNRNLLTSIVDAKNGTTLSHKAYSYDAIARPTARTMNERSDSFAYNAKSQLTAAQLGSDNYG